MTRLLRGLRLTYANVVATLALFVALGGVSYAAVQLSPNSVDTRHLRRGAVTAQKLDAASVTRAKLAPKLAASLPQGAAATAPTAWASVSYSGNLFASSGLGGGRIARVSPGVYCVTGLPFSVGSALVSPAGGAGFATNTTASVLANGGLYTGSGCTQAQAIVTITVAGETTPVDNGFNIWLAAE